LLGQTSDTEDTEGRVTELVEPRIPSCTEIEFAAARFVGEIQQRPPAFSAIKVSGRRAYSLARKGQEVELEARAVTIHSLNILDYVYPRLTLDIQCSSGTYIRSVGRDLAEALGTGAVMSALERTAIGQFHVAQSIDVALLSIDYLRLHLLPARLAVAHLPAVTLAQSDAQRIARGQYVDGRAALDAAHEPREFAAFDEGGNLVAILTPREGGLLGPVLNLAAGAR
jgi:tRNA pseudouridine55 synthase